MDENDHSNNKTQRPGPVDVAGDGTIRAPIFQHEGKNGPKFSTTIERRWKDQEGRWHTSHSFSETEALRASEALREARQKMVGLRHEQRQMREATADARDNDESREQFVEQRRETHHQSGGRRRSKREAPRER